VAGSLAEQGFTAPGGPEGSFHQRYGYLLGSVQRHLLTRDLRGSMLGHPWYFWGFTDWISLHLQWCILSSVSEPLRGDAGGATLVSENMSELREWAISHKWHIKTSIRNIGSMRIWVRCVAAFSYSQERKEETHAWEWQVGRRVAPFIEERSSPHSLLDLSVSNRLCVIGLFEIVTRPKAYPISDVSHSYSHWTGVKQVTLRFPGWNQWPCG
jgi:hypothetical protein